MKNSRKTTTFFIHLLFLSIAFCFISCEKDSFLSENAVLLANKTWQATHVDLDHFSFAVDPTDPYSEFNHTIHFLADQSFEMKEFNRPVSYGNWLLNKEDKKLVLMGQSQDELLIADVVLLGPQHLILQYQVDDEGDKYTLTLTYSPRP